MLTGYLLLPVYLKERQDTIYVLDEEKVSNKVVYSMIHPELFFHTDEILLQSDIQVQY